jgi:hypothetical protein
MQHPAKAGQAVHQNLLEGQTMTNPTLTKLTFAAALIGFSAIASPAFAQNSAAGQDDIRAQKPGIAESGSKFIGIDLDNRSVFYNGRNSGVYCIYQTVPVYNRFNGYYENRRTRRCGRGLYL